MRTAVLVFALLLLLCACNGVIPAGDGRYTSNATATSADDNPIQRAHDQAETFCKARGKPLVIESTAGSIRPGPASWSVHFRCGYPPPVRESAIASTPASVPAAPPAASSSAAPQPALVVALAPAAAANRYSVRVSFASLASGTDPVAEAAFAAELKTLENELGRSIERRTVHWGREGEYDVCLDLAEVAASRKQAFIEQLKRRFRASDRTGLQEDAECGG